jgi:hypothetical protein
MKAQFFNRQNDDDLLNGKMVGNSTELSTLLEKLDDSMACFYELIGENGYNLLLGMSTEMSCAQYSRGDGAPPYMMAIRPSTLEAIVDQDFYTGGVATPVPGHFCLPRQLGVQIASEFMESGGRSHAVNWEEV